MSSLRPSARRAVALCLVLLCGAASSANADTAKPAETFYVEIGQSNGPDNLVYGFFDRESGQRIARLQVAHVRLDYGKHGVFRVAWKARPLLSGVELRIENATAWPSVVDQLAEAFQKMGGAGGVVIRDLVILRPGEEPRIAAADAELTTARELVLPRAMLAGGEPHRVVLPLRGPHAGSFQISPLRDSTSSRSGAAP